MKFCNDVSETTNCSFQRQHLSYATKASENSNLTISNSAWTENSNLTNNYIGSEPDQPTSQYANCWLNSTVTPQKLIMH
jgi:hypothetical protein